MEPARPLRRKIDHELMIAANVQTHLLPKEIPNIDGYQIHAYYKPCDFIGGDYYDFIRIDKNNIGIAIADISGKGIPAALMMVETRALLRNEAPRTLFPSMVASRLNKAICHDMPKGMFVTLFYAVLNFKKNTVTYASCGHDPMIYFSSRDKKISLLNSNSIALGVVNGNHFSVEENKFNLNPFDFFMLNTDGVGDTIEEKKELYAKAEKLCSDTGGLMKTLVHDLEIKANSTQDDAAIILVQRT